MSFKEAERKESKYIFRVCHISLPIYHFWFSLFFLVAPGGGQHRGFWPL